LGLKDKIVLASITSTFNAIRGVIQLFSGFASDFLGGRLVVSLGFTLAGLAFVLSAAIPNANPQMTQSHLISLWVGCAAILGIGVGSVYPILAAEIGKVYRGQDRDIAITVFRWWRELGYAVGGAISIPILGQTSIATCVIIIGLLLWVTAVIMFLFYGQELFWTKCYKSKLAPMVEDSTASEPPTVPMTEVSTAPTVPITEVSTAPTVPMIEVSTAPTVPITEVSTAPSAPMTDSTASEPPTSPEQSASISLSPSEP